MKLDIYSVSIDRFQKHAIKSANGQLFYVTVDLFAKGVLAWLPTYVISPNETYQCPGKSIS